MKIWTKKLAQEHQLFLLWKNRTSPAPSTTITAAITTMTKTTMTVRKTTATVRKTTTRYSR